MDTPCKGKKFGHNFAYPGGPCLNCGISQNDLSKKLKPKKIKDAIKKPINPTKGIHSKIHALAKDLSEYCNEPKKFGLYLGVIKRIGLNRAFQILGEIKQLKNIKSRAKIFMYLSKNDKKMILPIEKGANNEYLRKKSLPVDKIDDRILDLIKDMIQTMIKNDGAGLSACQIGQNLRIFVIAKGLAKKQVFINPEIVKTSKKTEICDEGCLSFPEMFIKIPRARSLKIKAIDETGKEFKLKAKGLCARAIQHETEHLDGILLVDHE